ncbi:LOW QUALITY PROTEIN: hypothetical protein PanWU01x14_241680 [Parasponia andersonii]|uniref:Uncharacterized protein n=1 Tax=Parasponia andersonii TaxID=3476 RepID=A0A2P5BG59_PARAD|nr:LOW QUALITY PROTEIN: hypothetical protein PanWU01x14_241680 [Parasponia andersonii]
MMLLTAVVAEEKKYQRMARASKTRLIKERISSLVYLCKKTFPLLFGKIFP